MKIKVFTRVWWKWFSCLVPQHYRMKNISYTSNFVLHCYYATLDLVYCFQVSFGDFYAPCFVSKFPSKQFIDMFAQMFESTSFAKFSRIMKSNNFAISMIKSWKFHVFYQSCPLSCTCKLSCVGQASWKSQILHIFTPQNLVQAFWCVVTLLYFLCKNYVKKHQDSVVT